MPAVHARVPILYLAPWVDIGGSDKGTIDWFRFLDRDRFAPSLITTQPSANRRLAEALPYADEVWDLPDLMAGDEFARFILTFIHTRGVELVHVMNSRLGFELLPDITGLPRAPRTVVQLHVEEADRSGYVRYVSTRYGNLVDAFSVSSEALSERLGAYEVPLAKRRLIRTGVDGAGEFSPTRVTPRPGFDPDVLHILYPARVTAQKDPLLMVQVAARLRADGIRFALHVLGEGDLAASVRERIRVTGIEDEVIMHGECVDVAPWYAACDLVLLTSEYEGVPYVIYEAMAMATPVIAPDLAGVAELLTPEAGVLVSRRDQPGAYVAAIRALAADPERRAAMGEAGRVRASEFSLERMAAEHGSLYDELLGTVPNADLPDGVRAGPRMRLTPPRAALRSRRPGARPLVSVLVPCFNHGSYLEGCLRSIAEQRYAAVETILVDDGSTDPETLDVLAKVEEYGLLTLVRLPANGGPSAARNAAIERARGRYILPVDADNLLLPDAVSILVEQLSSAGESTGFVYPNYAFFGNRTDYFEPPSYNLHALLHENYCDTSSLIDREIFDRGFRYPEDVVLGHEDWDFVLTLAEHGIFGEPARGPTLLYRKHGFTRSDLVEAGTPPFSAVVARRHPGLFDEQAVKPLWNPAVSVIVLDSLLESDGEALRSLVTAARRQTCADFELVIRTDEPVWPTELGRRLRRLPRALAGSRAEALAQGLRIARGRYALAGYGSAAALLSDPTFIEKALRMLQGGSGDGLAFAHVAGEPSAPGWLDGERVQRAQLAALCWPTAGAGAPPPSLQLPGHRPLEAVTRWIAAHRTVGWRQLPGNDLRRFGPDPAGGGTPIGAPHYPRARDAQLRAQAIPQLPQLPPGVADRVRWPRVWTPPQTRMLCRHLDHASGRYVFTNDRTPPPDASLHYDLGCVRALPFAGTRALVIRADNGRPVLALDRAAELDDPELLGFVEQAPLPLFAALHVGRHRLTGQPVLIAGAEDPLAPMVDELIGVGYLEPYPIGPRQPSRNEVSYGLLGLVRAVDHGARRHRYAVGAAPPGRLAGELGAVFAHPTGDCTPLWLDADGAALTDGSARRHARPSLGTAARWTTAPLTWRQSGPLAPKVRAAARRAYDSARILAPNRVGCSPPRATPAGYLLRSPTEATLPLFSANHPVTGDQLLSSSKAEPRDLGYGEVRLLGYMIARAPVTGTLGVVRPGVPWAARFGLLGDRS